jgi:hypothetical protein
MSDSFTSHQSSSPQRSVSFSAGFALGPPVVLSTGDPPSEEHATADHTSATATKRAIGLVRMSLIHHGVRRGSPGHRVRKATG